MRKIRGGGDYERKYGTQIPNFMKICPVGADLFHAGEQMDKWRDGRTCKPGEANTSLKKVQIDNILNAVFDSTLPLIPIA